CDYRPLIDAKSSEDGTDTYAACRRAVAAARTAYERAATTAATLGWTHLVNETRGFQNRLNLRRQLIEMRAKGDALKLEPVFHPRSIGDVLVSREFEAGASTLGDTPMLANLIESVVAEADAQRGRPDARSLYLHGLTKDIRHAGPEAAAQYYAAAAELLGAERRGFFDPRRRGTVIENRGEIVRDLALRLLALGREADAFVAFESVRARGLGELASVLARPDVTADDRAWLAELLVLEARAGAIEQRIVAEMVASGQLDAGAEQLRELDGLHADRRARLRSNEAVRRRFAEGAIAPSATLDALRTGTVRSGIPVLLYWTTFGNVIAWYVGPDGSDVRNVFLPASVLEEKIGRVLASSGGTLGRQPYDETAARELFLFLLAPFAAQLSPASVTQIMIVPQGPLVRLPFEALIDPASGTPVIDRWAISYAPNATMAVAALQGEARPVRTVTALVDTIIDDNTKETAAIQASGAQLKTVTRKELFAGSWRADSLHMLTHGEFNSAEALLSSLAPTRPADPPLLAAELLALPLRGLPLAVLSACKGGRVGARISGEIYAGRWHNRDRVVALGRERGQQRPMDGRVLPRACRRRFGRRGRRHRHAGDAQGGRNSSLLLGGDAGQRPLMPNRSVA
ncbi:MAG: CHAT domain-containing protein, partial [Alphaproteobacteria bacterium]